MSTHARIGDIGSITTGSVSSSVCMCACAICLTGACCQFSRLPTTTAPYTNWPSLTHQHFFVPYPNYGRFGETRRIYCQGCGEVRSAEQIG